jgi:hypothetical protein
MDFSEHATNLQLGQNEEEKGKKGVVVGLG